MIHHYRLAAVAVVVLAVVAGYPNGTLVGGFDIELLVAFAHSGW